MAPPALRFEGVTKEYFAGAGVGRIRALEQFSVEVGAGQIFGLLGPNGCGKSTALRCAVGLEKVDGGAVWIGSESAGEKAAAVRLGYLPERGGVPTYLTAGEILHGWARLNQVSPTNVEELLVEVGLAGATDRRVGHFSKGMIQRLALAQALLPKPEILLLDEPFSGVDPLGVDLMMAVLNQRRQAGATILLTSHLLARVETICDEVALLDRGKLIVSGTVEAVLGESVQVRRGLDDVFREHLKGDSK